MSSKKSATKKQQITANKNSAAVEKTSNLSVSSVLSSLTMASLGVQSTLSKVGEEVMSHFAELEALETTIDVKKKELDDLHGKDKILLSIDEIKAEHDSTVAQLAKEVDDLKAAYEQAEVDEAERRRREQEDFDYQLKQTRKTADDVWAETLRLRLRDEKIRQEGFDKDINERAEQLLLKEKAYNDALAKAATFDEEVRKASARDVAIITSSLKKDYEHQSQMTAVQNQSVVDKLKFDNERLIQAANNYETQVKELQAQLKEAYAKNAELATKAVEGASNKQQLADMQSLVTNVGSNGSRART